MDIRKKDIYSGSFILLFATGLYAASFRIQELMDVIKLGSDFLPKLVAVILAFLGIILIIRGRKTTEITKNSEAQEDEKTPGINSHSTLVSLGLLIAYVALIESIGFIITTAVYLFLQFLVLTDKTQKKPLKFSIIAILTSVSVYYLFTVVFKVMIPSGILG